MGAVWLLADAIFCQLVQAQPVERKIPRRLAK